MKIRGIDKNIKDFAYVLAGNSLNLFAGVFSGLLIPKFLDMDQYGYYRIFTLYTLYLGVMHFGFNDGIYVRYGNYDYENLPKEKFRAYFRFLLIFQLVLSGLVGLLCLGFTRDRVTLNISMYTSANIVINNVILFFSMITQITRRFHIYSLNTVLSKVAFIIFTTILLLVNFNNHIYFIVSQTLVNLVSMGIFVFSARDLIFGKSEGIKENLPDILNNFKTGFLIMIGNFMGLVILNFGQFIAVGFLSIEDFAVYAFAISLISIVINTLLYAIASVVYPFLARSTGGDLKTLYERMEIFLFIVLSISLSGYFVLKFIILTFLPRYVNSLEIGLILFPIVLFNGLVSIVAANYYKVLRMQKGYTVNNVIAFGLVALATVVSYYAFKSASAIAVGALVSFYLWLLYSDFYFGMKLSVRFAKLHAALIVTVAVFLTSGLLFNWYTGMLTYLCLLAGILIVFYRSDLKKIASEKMNYLKV